MGSTGAQKVYTSVKSYNQRDRLLPKSIVQTLAESSDLDECVTRIKNTKYADGISKITKPYTAEKIKSVLHSHLADIHFSIAKTTGNLLLNAYYIIFLILNLKLKGKILSKSQSKIEPYLKLRAEEQAFCYTGFFWQNLKMTFENNFLIYI
jgi:V/A-type H+-transporting ATPase subunit C